MKALNTGCKGIDLLLASDSATVCEFAGIPASGKTQLAHWTCLFTLSTRSIGYKVVFIDSGTSFSLQRLRDFWLHSTFAQRRKSIDFNEMLKRQLLVFRCFCADDLATVLFKEIPRGCCLVVIDSISDILGPLAGSDHKTINQIGTLIKHISKDKQIPFIIINGSVSAGSLAWNDSSVPVGARTTKSKPALGASWSKFISKRLYFTPSKDRLDLHNALLSGRPLNRDDDVLAYEENGKIYSVVDNLVECVGNSKSCGLYIGKYRVFSDLKITSSPLQSHPPLL